MDGSIGLSLTRVIESLASLLLLLLPTSKPRRPNSQQNWEAMDSNLGEGLIGEDPMEIQRWRKLCGVVKDPKRRFRFTANLSKRAEAAAIRRTNQEKFRVAVLVSQAASQFIQDLGGGSREIVYRRGPGCKPKSS